MKEGVHPELSPVDGDTNRGSAPGAVSSTPTLDKPCDDLGCTPKEARPKPDILWSILSMHCPRCRRGSMFKNKHTYKKLTLSHIFDMYEECPVCHQFYSLEPGFWYGTGYVSYGLAVLISAISFIAWWFLIGISVNDNRVLYWVFLNAVLIILLQPWLMRISRVVYLYLFVKYNKNYDKDPLFTLREAKKQKGVKRQRLKFFFI